MSTRVSQVVANSRRRCQRVARAVHISPHREQRVGVPEPLRDQDPERYLLQWIALEQELADAENERPNS